MSVWASSNAMSHPFGWPLVQRFVSTMNKQWERKMSKTSDEVVHDPEGGIARLLEIMRRLRDPHTGCTWDIEQDFATIAPYTIEEAYEVSDAIEREAWDELRGELGDLLFQSV